MSIDEVLKRQRSWAVQQGDCVEVMADFPPASIDLVFGSPPYAEKGERYIGGAKKWTTDDWVTWMLEVTTAALRVSKGYVMWVANGSVRKSRYLPSCELLLAQAHKFGIICERPVIWHKNAPPNRRDWFGNDYEFVLVFKASANDLYFDWESIAEAPKYKNGGAFRQRTSNGERRIGSEYPQNKLARPRDVVRVTVGGGHLGSPLAHENEAPFPEQLASKFVLACCPQNGVVLDPFSGSGTTGAVALKTNRRYVGIDIRESQVDLTKRRLSEHPPSLF